MEFAETERIVLQNVGHADFEEPAAGPQRREASRNEFSSQRVQDNVHAFAVRQSHHLLSEIQRPRIHDMLNALCREEFSLFRASSCGVNLGTDLLRDLKSGLSDTASRSMDQHALALAQPAEVVQRVVRGHERDGDRDRFLEAEMRRLPGDKCGIGRDERSEARGGQRDGVIPGFQVVDTVTTSHDRPGAFPAQVERLLEYRRDEAHGHENVAKVEADGANLNLDLARPWLLASRATQREIVENPGCGDLQPERLACGNQSTRLVCGLGRVTHHARDPSFAVSKCDLIFPIAGCCSS